MKDLAALLPFQNTIKIISKRQSLYTKEKEQVKH
jgi:hypothetical protein